MDDTETSPLEIADRVTAGVCTDCEDPDLPVVEDGYCQSCWEEMAEDWLEERRRFARSVGWPV